MGGPFAQTTEFTSSFGYVGLSVTLTSPAVSEHDAPGPLALNVMLRSRSSTGTVLALESWLSAESVAAPTDQIFSLTSVNTPTLPTEIRYWLELSAALTPADISQWTWN